MVGKEEKRGQEKFFLYFCHQVNEKEFPPFNGKLRGAGGGNKCFLLYRSLQQCWGLSMDLRLPSTPRSTQVSNGS